MLVLNDITVSDPTHETPNSVRGKEEKEQGYGGGTLVYA